jgi:hypothetical protein
MVFCDITPDGGMARLIAEDTFHREFIVLQKGNVEEMREMFDTITSEQVGDRISATPMMNV